MKDTNGFPSYVAATMDSREYGTFHKVMPNAGIYYAGHDNNYDYLSWGIWAVSAVGAGAVGSVGFHEVVSHRSHWIAGSLTHDVNMPKTGKAEYIGPVIGMEIYRYTTNGDYLSSRTSKLHGTAELTAYFSSDGGYIDGRLSMRETTHEAFQEFNTTGAITADLNNVSISGNQFSGGLSGDHINTGKIHGAFYGPQAQEMGGNWAISGDKYEAVGIFTGKQQ